MLKMPLKRQEIISGTQPWAGAFQTSEIIDHSRPFHLQIDAMNFGLGPVGQVISYDFAAQVGKPPEALKEPLTAYHLWKLRNQIKIAHNREPSQKNVLLFTWQNNHGTTQDTLSISLPSALGPVLRKQVKSNRFQPLCLCMFPVPLPFCFAMRGSFGTENILSKTKRCVQAKLWSAAK